MISNREVTFKSGPSQGERSRRGELLGPPRSECPNPAQAGGRRERRVSASPIDADGRTYPVHQDAIETLLPPRAELPRAPHGRRAPSWPTTSKRHSRLAAPPQLCLRLEDWATT